MNKLIIDRKVCEFAAGETILEIAGRNGIQIPHLCFSHELNSCGNCMICAVKVSGTQIYLPACSTRAADNMEIESETEELAKFRVSALEILLAEHRGDCEGPCAMVCPQGLDIPGFLKQLAADNSPQKFLYNAAICEECGGRCERACRRGRVDTAIKIREQLSAFAEKTTALPPAQNSPNRPYFHILGMIKAEQIAKFYQIENTSPATEAQRCLQCQCSALTHCELRDMATTFRLKGNRLKLDSLPFRKKIVTETIAYDPEKCIKCNRCIALGNRLTPGNGPAMVRRGIHACIDAPVGMTFSQVFAGREEDYIAACPTGALSRP